MANKALVKGLKAVLFITGRTATKAEVKANKTDIGGNFYIYDLYAEDGELLALNRYVYKNSGGQPFEELTEAEELILNPVIEDPEGIKELPDGKQN